MRRPPVAALVSWALVGGAAGCECEARPGEAVAPATPIPATPAPSPTEGAGEPEAPSTSGESRERAFVDAMLNEALAKDFAGRPELLRRVRGSAFGFFRSVNVSFSECVCRAYGDRVRGAPPVNLHGDAHLEQYAVTDEGRGLTDFDDATLGPALLDLARFATSIRLALRGRGWTDHVEAVEARFWEGYREGLEHPDEVPDAPAYVARIRAANRRPRGEALAASERFMRPLEPGESERVLDGLERYGRERHALDGSLPEGYFVVKKLGRLEMGIGSALDRKYLFRVEGPGPAADDDLLLEAKEVRSLRGIPCVFSAQDRNPLRIVLAAERLAYQPYEHAGFYMGPEWNFWIHAWQTNYVELAVAPGEPGSLRDVDELLDVVHDVAFQLGRGHPKQVGTPIEARIRPYLVRAVEENAEQASTEVARLADAVVEAWRRFREAVPDPGG